MEKGTLKIKITIEKLDFTTNKGNKNFKLILDINETYEFDSNDTSLEYHNVKFKKGVIKLTNYLKKIDYTTLNND